MEGAADWISFCLEFCAVHTSSEETSCAKTGDVRRLAVTERGGEATAVHRIASGWTARRPHRLNS